MRLHIYLAVALAAGLTGCASIVNGQNQSISVDARSHVGPIAAAQCTLTNDKGTWYVTTPGSTTVHRSFSDLAVRCQKDALQPGLLTVKSSTKPMAFGNIIFGGVIGAGVDIATGAAYDYPSLITVIMGQSGSQGGPIPAAPAAAAPTKTLSASVPAAAASAAM